MNEPPLPDLNALLRGLESLLADGLPADIKLILELDPQFPAFPMDILQMHRIVHDLVKNAQDAMEGPGCITIRTYRILVNPSDTEAPETIPEVFGCLEVQDEGKGIEAGDRERIFEPFSSTKGPGKGTSLGLSVVTSAARAYGGFARCLSEPGRGSCFQVFFPIGPLP